MDIATPHGSAVSAMLGYATTGVMASGRRMVRLLDPPPGTWRAVLAHAGLPEHEDLIRSDYVPTSATPAVAGGAITAGLFLKHFTQGLPGST